MTDAGAGFMRAQWEVTMDSAVDQTDKRGNKSCEGRIMKFGFLQFLIR